VDLIARPNALMTGDRFVSAITKQALIDGHSFAALGARSSRNVPVEMVPLSDSEVAPLRPKADLYTLDGWVVKKKQMAPEDVLRFEWSGDPDDPLGAIPPLEAAQTDLDVEAAAAEFSRSSLDRGSPLGGLLKWTDADRRLTEEDLDTAARRFNDKYSGTNAADGVAVLTGSWDYQSFGHTARDLQFLEGRDFIQSRLGLIYGVPPVLLGDYSSTGLSSAGISLARRVLYENAVIPFARHIEAVLTRGLALPVDENLRIVFDFTEIEALRDDYKEKLDQAEALQKIGYPLNVINEQLGLGMPELEGVGDEVLVSSGLITASAAVALSDLPLDVPAEADSSGEPATTPSAPAVKLNGAQAAAVVKIVESITAGDLPVDTAKGMLQTMFALSPAQADAIIGSATPPEQAASSDPERTRAQVKVPGYIRRNAALGLEYHLAGKSGDGIRPHTIREAHELAAGSVSDAKVARMSAWFARHASDLEAEKNSDADHPDYPGAGAVAWLLWGGHPTDDPMAAKQWADAQLDDEQEEAPRTVDRAALVGDDLRLWRANEAFLLTQERRVLGKLRRDLMAQRAAVLAALEDDPVLSKRNIDDATGKFDSWQFARSIQSILGDVYVSAFAAGLDEIADFEDVVSDAAMEYQENRLPEVAEYKAEKRVGIIHGIGEQFAQALNQQILEGYNSGENLRDMMQRVRGVFNTGVSRARTIARTETGIMNSAAKFESGQVAGMKLKKWLYKADDVVRPSHEECGREGFIPASQSFSNGLEHPHSGGAAAEVVNCRCSIRWSNRDADNE
jgi:HK97 family phage portal protein